MNLSDTSFVESFPGKIDVGRNTPVPLNTVAIEVRTRVISLVLGQVHNRLVLVDESLAILEDNRTKLAQFYYVWIRLAVENGRSPRRR